MKKYIVLLLACLLALSGCGNGAGETTAPSTESEPTLRIETTAPDTQPVTEPVTEPQNTDVNPLTGLPVDTPYDGSRPYAVMINNISVAQPQCGTTQADIMYEVLVEGGITRMMAIFSDLDSETPIGSIRSLRPYYLSIARAYDAIVVHAGGSTQAYTDLTDSGWDHIDGVNGSGSGSYFYRVQERIDRAGYEHSMFIDARDAVEYAEAQDCRFYHEGHAAPFTFTDEPLAAGEAAGNVTVHFRTSKETAFTYDGQTGLYAGAQYGDDWADGNDGTVQTFRNLLVLHAQTQTVDDVGRLAVTLVGSGDGYLIRDGYCIPIHWSRGAEDTPFLYTDEAGQPLSLGVGRSYIAITPPESALDLE